ncbi:MAG: small multi-drug export protein [Euryarchaeota archaeon]|nr:small multi-drug export protein [Euryarchaeota archaeon]
MSFRERFMEEIMLVKDFAHELKSWRTVFYFFFPWSLYGLFILIIYFLFPPKLNMAFILITFLYLIPPAGKESMVPAGVILLRGWLGPWSMPVVALSIAFVDSFVGLWMMWNWDLIKLIPFLGSYIRKLEKIGEEKWRKHKHLSHLAYVGIALFVAFPFQGSGGVGATVIGRILGMNKYRVLYSIIFGSIFGCFLIAFLTYFAIFSFENFPKIWLVVAGIIIFIIVFIIAIKWIRGGKK